jgi:TolB-like protein/DNA-binding SARP family transcriptional activator
LRDRIRKPAQIELDRERYELRRDGRVIRLERIPMDLLFLLVENRGQLLTRDEIVEKLWDPDIFFDSEHGINTAICKIRRALADDAGRPRFIETVIGKGYRFIGELGPIGLAEVKRISAKTARKGRHKIMLVVLPLVNLSRDAEQEFFTDGLTEELISQLGSLNSESLGVIARTTSMTYKDTRKSVRQIGDELGVEYLFEGSVRRTGTHVKVTAQLIETRQATHVWSQSYRREIADVFAVQEALARAIAGQILDQLPPRKSSLVAARRVSPDVQETYLKGRYHLNRLTLVDLKKAVQFFKLATRHDPAMAPAYAGLALTFGFLIVLNALPPREGTPKGLEAAEHALRLDPNLGETYEALGVLHNSWWAWDQAERELRRAVKLNPSSANAHRFLGVKLMATGYPGEGIEEMLQARRIDPLSLVINAEVVRNYYFGRMYEKAIEHGRATLEMDPHFARTHFWLGRAYEQAGMLEEAIMELRQASELSPQSMIYRGDLAHAYALAGRRTECLEIVSDLEKRAEHEYVCHYTLAAIQTALGKKSAAFARFEMAFEAHSWAFLWLKTDPRLDDLRSTPEFQSLVHRVGLRA